jgi:hypothetical protein
MFAEKHVAGEGSKPVVPVEPAQATESVRVDNFPSNLRMIQRDSSRRGIDVVAPATRQPITRNLLPF